MDHEERPETRGGLRRKAIRGPWAYLIVATPVIVFLYAAAFVINAGT